MSRLTQARDPVTRETTIRYRTRPLVAELHAGYLLLWPKGTRQTVMVDYAAIYDLGLKLAARDRRTA